MASKYMKRCSTSLIIRVTPIKILMQCYFTPILRLKFKRLTIPSVGEIRKLLELSYIADGNVQWHNHFGKICQFHIKVKIRLPYSVILLLGIFPRKMST